MLVSVPGVVVASGGSSYPPAGTILASVCSGNTAYDSGNADYFDANGTQFTGMFTLWNQVADGSGGSSWVSGGDNSSSIYASCWYPAGYYMENSSTDNYVEWSGCGSSGSTAYSYSTNYAYSNGDGTSTTGSGGGSYISSGDTLYDNGSGCCYVYYDGSGGYYVSDSCGGGCPSAGSIDYYACMSTSGTDASGTYFDGAWQYAAFYTDGNCGYSPSPEGDPNGNGCYYPYGWFTSYSSYSNELSWAVTSYNDSSYITVSGSYNYGNGWSGQRSDGSGGTYDDSYSYSASYGDLIYSGDYTDPVDSMNWHVVVSYDGSGGFYYDQYPT